MWVSGFGTPETFRGCAGRQGGRKTCRQKEKWGLRKTEGAGPECLVPIHFDLLVRFRFLPGKTGKRNRK
jgi:hypothetical protein